MSGPGSRVLLDGEPGTIIRCEYDDQRGYCYDVEMDSGKTRWVGESGVRVGRMISMPDELSPEERDLLTWLGEEEFSQYGECHGAALDALIAKGLAQRHPGTGRNNTFIAKGDGPMFEAVSLTEAGVARRKELIA